MNRWFSCAAVVLSAFVESGVANAASLADGQVLNFSTATTGGGYVQPTLGTGSWFGQEINPGQFVYVPIHSYNGIILGASQSASGSHAGSVNGSESPDIDSPWTFLGNTGMHMTTSPVNVLGPSTLDFSGWAVHWNGAVTLLGSGDYGTGGTATYTYDNASGLFSLDYSVTQVDITFTPHTYMLHLEGAASPVPLPAAIWLFGAGLLPLIAASWRRAGS